MKLKYIMLLHVILTLMILVGSMHNFKLYYNVNPLLFSWTENLAINNNNFFFTRLYLF